MKIYNFLCILFIITVTIFPVYQQIFPSITQVIVKADSENSSITYPYLYFSTYFGGEEAADQGKGIAVSNDGCYYVSGSTKSTNFPTLNAYDSTYNGGGSDLYIAKFSPNNVLLWSTFFGGNNSENNQDIAVARDGSCYIIGSTQSVDFPTKNAYQTTFNGGFDDIYIAKFSKQGLLLWSTYLGGSGDFDIGYGIDVASDGSCYVTGETTSTDFPIKNAFSGVFNGENFDAFITKFSSKGKLLWSTYLGGDWNDAGKAVTVSRDGGCFVTGCTWSSDFPTLNAFDSSPNGYWDVFITQFSANGELLWSTYFGGDDWDEGLGIDVSYDGSCYLTGFARSTNFPLLNYNSSYGNGGGGGDAFVSKFAANGSLLWSTFLGGNGIERSYDIAVIDDGRCYVTGETFSTNFPTKVFNSTLSGGYDAFVTCFSANGSLLWSTYHGGEGMEDGDSIAVTDDGCCYLVGTTTSDDFPTENAYDDALGDSHDAFIVRIMDTPVLRQPVNGSLVFIAVAPAFAFMMVIGIIFFKNRK